MSKSRQVLTTDRAVAKMGQVSQYTARTCASRMAFCCKGRDMKGSAKPVLQGGYIGERWRATYRRVRSKIGCCKDEKVLNKDCCLALLRTCGKRPKVSRELMMDLKEKDTVLPIGRKVRTNLGCYPWGKKLGERQGAADGNDQNMDCCLALLRTCGKRLGRVDKS